MTNQPAVKTRLERAHFEKPQTLLSYPVRIPSSSLVVWKWQKAFRRSLCPSTPSVGV